MTTDSAQLIASLQREGLNLELKTLDLCFLVALYTRARDKALTCFDEELLIDVFEQICELIEPGTENPRKRLPGAGLHFGNAFGRLEAALLRCAARCPA